MMHKLAIFGLTTMLSFACWAFVKMFDTENRVVVLETTMEIMQEVRQDVKTLLQRKK